MSNTESPKEPLSARKSLAAAVRQPNLEQYLAASSPSIKEALQKSRVEEGKKVGSLRDIQVEFVTNPERGVDFDIRHNQLLIRDELVKVLSANNPVKIRELEEQIAESGGFLLKYDGEGRERLLDAYDFKNPKKGGWLMAETSAIPLDRGGNPLTKNRVLGADGQFYIPPDSDDASPDLFPLLEAGTDSILDGETISEDIKTRPAHAMLIADISAVREYSRFGFAAVTEDAAFYRLIHEINQQRERVIKYVVAAVASVKGVMDNRGVLQAPVLEQSGLRNWRSLNLHTNRGNARGFLHGKQKNHEVPVTLLNEQPGKLLVDWYVTIQEVKKISPPQNLFMFDEKVDRE